MYSNLELLQEFAPELHFTQGEMFFPMAIEDYLAQCSAWVRESNGQARAVAQIGELTPENLGRLATESSDTYLQYVQKPMDLTAYLRWRRSEQRPAFEAVGRWARVGLAARLLDAAYDAASALRGQVPGGTTAVAEQQYRTTTTGKPPVYYGRVIREAGYTILHYIFFYAMNDFRSSFYGVNDHEADWEQVFVYVVEPDVAKPELAEVVPTWVAYASHDLTGADLRRRWDDPAVQIVRGTHPVVYVAAGSHASYVEPGEYLFGVQPRFLRPAYRLVQAGQRLWEETLRQGVAESDARRLGSQQVSIPFVDYARGDGRQLGAPEHPWQAVELTGTESWASTYRGLWGLDTRDPLGGERAPAGPKFARSGELRQSWYDPLGFAGLEATIAFPRLAAAQRNRLTEIAHESAQLATQIEQLRAGMQARFLDASAISSSAAAELADEPAQLQSLLRRKAELEDAHTATAAAVQQGSDPGPPRAHLRRAHEPLPVLKKLPWGGELWSATSGGLLLILLGVLPALTTAQALVTLTVGLAAVFGIDAVVRGQGIRYTLRYTVLIAGLSTLGLAVLYWKLALMGAVGLLALSTVRDNIRELRLLQHRALHHRQR